MSGRTCWAWFGIALAIAVVFANSLQGEYHLDSVYRVQLNSELEQLFPLHRHFLDPTTSATLPTLVAYRPFLPLSLSLNLAFSRAIGLDPLVGYHLGNVFLHMLAACALYSVLLELLRHWSGGDLSERARPIALAASLLFALHPVAGVPVNYLCGRDVTLMLGFLMLSFLAYLRWRRLGSALRLGLSLLLALAALSSKTSAVAFPALIFVFEITAGGESLVSLRTWCRTLIATLPVAAFFLITEGLLGFSDRGQVIIERASAFEYPLTELHLHLTHYLRNAFWPFRLRAMPMVEAAQGLLEVGVLAGIAFSAGCAVFVLKMRARAPLAAFSVAAYWALFMPTSSFMAFRSFAADYRQVPSLAFGAFFVVLALERLLRGRARTVAPVLAILAAGASTITINRHWRTEESLWEQSVRYGGTALAHMNYAVAVRGRDAALAEKHLLRTLELVPTHIYGHLNLGLLRIEAGEVEEGIALLDKAAEGRPSWAVVHHWRAIGLENAGRLKDALLASRRACELDPKSVEYSDKLLSLLYGVAREYQMAGELPASIPLLEELHRSTPFERDSRFLLGFARQQTGDRAGAIQEYRSLLQEFPKHARAVFNLAYAHMGGGEYELARAGFVRSLELDATLIAAHSNLATCLRALGLEEEAQREEALGVELRERARKSGQ